MSNWEIAPKRSSIIKPYRTAGPPPPNRKGRKPEHKTANNRSANDPEKKMNYLTRATLLLAMALCGAAFGCENASQVRLNDGPSDVDADTDTDNDADTAPADEDDMTAQLAEVEAQAADYLDILQRERATFQNYKRRVERERAEQKQLLEGEMLLKLLPVLDDFYRAMDAVPEAEQDDWYAGVAMILKKFERYLTDAGVAEMEAQGALFNPAYHEAIGVDSASDVACDTVTMVLQRGYMLGDRVLRPAMVRVAG